MLPMRCVAAAVFVLVMLSACGGRTDGPRAGTDALPTTPRGAAEPAEEQPVGPAAGNDRPGTDATGDRTPIAVVLSQRCESPVGFGIDYPGGWAVNSGDTVPPCTRFAPGPFIVAPGTDARVAAVNASIRVGTFDEIVSAQLSGAADRTRTTVDGRRAVRIERESVGEGLYPAGVRMTSFVIELEPGADGAQTLVIDTLGLPSFDYARNVQVLDLMIGTVDLGDL